MEKALQNLLELGTYNEFIVHSTALHWGYCFCLTGTSMPMAY